jgi:acyl carrier protein
MRAAFSLFLVGSPTGRQLLSAGAVGQTLMTLAPRLGLGFCPIGRFATTDRLRKALSLSDSEQILYAFEGGAIRPDQTQQWPVEAAASPAQQLDELRDFLRAKLPSYMVPSVFVPIERLPLNQNGKVDRKALPKTDAVSSQRATEYEAPRNDVERLIALKWGELLRAERIGIFDNFFERGGDSLAATRFVSAIRNEFAADAARVSLETFFGSPTVAAVAELIEVARDARRLQENCLLMTVDGEVLEEGSL